MDFEPAPVAVGPQIIVCNRCYFFGLLSIHVASFFLILCLLSYSPQKSLHSEYQTNIIYWAFNFRISKVFVYFYPKSSQIFQPIILKLIKGKSQYNLLFF